MNNGVFIVGKSKFIQCDIEECFYAAVRYVTPKKQFLCSDHGGATRKKKTPMKTTPGKKFGFTDAFAERAERLNKR